MKDDGKSSNVWYGWAGSGRDAACHMHADSRDGFRGRSRALLDEYDCIIILTWHRNGQRGGEAVLSCLFDCVFFCFAPRWETRSSDGE